MAAVGNLFASNGMSMKREFTTSVAWSTAASWVEQIAAALIFLVIAKLIGVESFGIVSMAFAFLFLGEFLVRDTIAEAIVERHKIEPGRLEATFAVLMALSVVIVLALVVIAHIAAIVYKEPIVTPLLIAASPTVLMIAAAGVPLALLRRRLAYKTLAIRTVVGVMLGGSVGIGMALNGFGAWSLVGQRLTEIAVNSLLTFIAAGWVPRKWPSRSELALVRGLGPRVLQLRFVTLVIFQTPTVMLGYFADPRAVGLFAFAARLAEIVLTVFVKNLQGVAQSVVAELRRKRDATAGFYLDLTELAAISGFVAYAGLALISYPLVELLLGPDWREAGQILPFLCLAYAVISLTSIQEAYLLAVDRPKPFLWATLAEAVLGLILIALASRYGPVATAAAVAVRALVALPLRMRATHVPEGISALQFLRVLKAPLVLAAGMSLIVGTWRLAMLGHIPDALYVASAILIGAGSVGLILFCFMPGAVARLRTFTHASP
ncbi:oligosaccharide flippase family protein [Ruegeria sp. HKCCD4332]|uniref:oligosaccharide flippase family protein n=1 Tax=Ruegeria sp. HKCCD4332 TaxID=2683021 RepID=UPI00149232ED|nr:oligosaccharide flippase family protein [Ruegeria sp. HKCCD4332]NOD78566.1 oligosaccharide flippase family protein [Ruegeria sp. HKCCD4332]